MEPIVNNAYKVMINIIWKVTNWGYVGVADK
jgi:hypothetical protein